jgi:phenylacetate-coenzyme A ligase PaaK-like adenylate-forming protein
VGGQYALIVDRRSTMVELEARVELADGIGPNQVDAVRADLESALARTSRIRVRVDVRAAGSIPRQEVGKARRVFERTGADDPVT